MTEATHDNITVTELPDGPAGAVLGSVLGVYEQHGYEAGYHRAVQDVLLSLLGVTEDFIRQRGLAAPAARELRQVIWAYHAHLQRRSERLGSAAGYVEGGLGI
jgi:hypothetical protein